MVILLLPFNIFSASSRSLKKNMVLTLKVLLIISSTKGCCDRCLVVSDEVALSTPGCGAPGQGCSWGVVADNDGRILFVSVTNSDGDLDGQIFVSIQCIT